MVLSTCYSCSFCLCYHNRTWNLVTGKSAYVTNIKEGKVHFYTQRLGCEVYVPVYWPIRPMPILSFCSTEGPGLLFSSPSPN